jgi:6-phosphofructokinase 1
MLDEMVDPRTGRIRLRLVDVTTESYEVARKYMIRLEPHDLTEPRLSRLAAQTVLDPDAFAARFGRLFENVHKRSAAPVLGVRER